MSTVGIAIAISTSLQTDSALTGAASVDNFIQQDGTNFVQQDGVSIFLTN